MSYEEGRWRYLAVYLARINGQTLREASELVGGVSCERARQMDCVADRATRPRPPGRWEGTRRRAGIRACAWRMICTLDVFTQGINEARRG